MYSEKEIDDLIDEWHDGDDSRDLNEFLGMTHEEYTTWVERPKIEDYTGLGKSSYPVWFIPKRTSGRS